MKATTDHYTVIRNVLIITTTITATTHRHVLTTNIPMIIVAIKVKKATVDHHAPTRSTVIAFLTTAAVKVTVDRRASMRNI
jgi:hypothetical protein